MQLLTEVLRRNGLHRPDGRALHAYGLDAVEMKALTEKLRLRIDCEQPLKSTAQAFVLWAAERLRTAYPGGQLTWEFVFEGLGQPRPDYSFVQKITEDGLLSWRRQLKRGQVGHREFLYSLLAEGGLPEIALAEAGTYRTALLGLIAEIEAEGALGAAQADRAAMRAVEGLPHALQGAEQARLMAELACALVTLRGKLPDAVPRGAAVDWLDANLPGWRRELPLRLSPHVLDVLIRPVLAAERLPAGRTDAAVIRQLRRSIDGSGWQGVAVIVEGAVLPADLLPHVDRTLRLRLSAENGVSFLGQPEAEGWRLTRQGVGREAILPLDPSVPVVLSAFTDGTKRADVILDAGLPVPADASTLWRPQDAQAVDPEILVPLSGRGRTLAGKVFLLAAPGELPVASEGLTIELPQPGPGGQIWPISGNGCVKIGNAECRVETGSDADDPTPRLVALGQYLSGFVGPSGALVHLGRPQILGTEGDAPLGSVQKSLSFRAAQGRLGGVIASWQIDGVTLARLSLIVLPQTLSLVATELGVGRLRLDCQGLDPGWHVAILGPDAEARAVVPPGGQVRLELVSKELPGVVTLRLSNPQAGTRLDLSALWPAREPILVEPGGRRLTTDRKLSLANLTGWRGLAPSGRGAVQLRDPGKSARIGFPAGGEVRLAAHADVIGQALALSGPDGRINIRLVEGTETPRLEIGRYDWVSEEAGPFRHLGHGRTDLAAVLLDEPVRREARTAEGRIDLNGWLGEVGGIWFIQGRSRYKGIMRPFVWSAQPMSHTSREVREAGYEAEWRTLLAHPEDARWEAAWALISAVRAAGDAGALDQVQALGRVPEAAVAMLFQTSRGERAAALLLETEAPLWWPLVPWRAWASGIKVANDRLNARLRDTGIEESEALGALQMSRVAGEIMALRPELASHLGRAMWEVGLDPIARDSSDRTIPLARPSALLPKLAQEAARRFDWLPQGAGSLAPQRLQLPPAVNEANAPVMYAPFVAAEVAAGLRAAPSPTETLQFIALRAADPIWFDAALPAALTQATELPE